MEAIKIGQIVFVIFFLYIPSGQLDVIISKVVKSQS